MSETVDRTGRCACGTTVLQASVERRYGACHCETCRRWSTGAFLATLARGVVFQNPATLRHWRSSDWAERLSCATCGTPLAVRMLEAPPGEMYLSVGLLDDQTDLEMAMEIFVDRQPPHFRFEGPRERLTAQEFMDRFVNQPPEPQEQP